MNNKGRRSFSVAAATFLIAGVLGGNAYTAHHQEVVTAMSCAVNEGCAEASVLTDGDVVIGSRLWELFTSEDESSETAADARPSVIVGGAVFGTRIKEARISVGSAEDGCALKEGDRIISINGRDVRSISDVRSLLKESDGSALSVVCERSGRSVTLKCTPKLIGGEYRLGVVLREGSAGIGTITYIDPNSGVFGGLGHGICDSESGKIIEMSGGTVTDVILGGIIKGESGNPGELSGILTDRPTGDIYANTECGVFGQLTRIPKGCGSLMPIAYRSEVREGDAKIISTLKNGATMEYKIEISDIKASATGAKCFKIRVTDEALLAISGGIVRGMSGSPIIQDGKLVGAVTHVMVADPTEGYGIFIENMLNAAQMPMAKAS